MGTRGAWGFIKGGVEKITYNHFDSYPEGLGADIFDFCKGHAHEVTFDAITMVNQGDKPTKAQKTILKKFGIKGAEKVSTGDDFYAFLRSTQGEPIVYTQGFPYMLDSRKFLGDSLFCEWAYLINLDEQTLEVYEGFVKTPEKCKGRYATPESLDNGYYGVSLILTLTFDEVKALSREEFVELAQKSASQDEE